MVLYPGALNLVQKISLTCNIGRGLDPAVAAAVVVVTPILAAVEILVVAMGEALMAAVMEGATVVEILTMVSRVLVTPKNKTLTGWMSAVRNRIHLIRAWMRENFLADRATMVKAIL
jgi:hypothetical protein